MTALSNSSITHTVLVAGFAVLAGLSPAMAQTLMMPTEAAPKGAPKAPAKAPEDGPKLNFLPADFLAHPNFVLSAPPKPDSAETQRELATLKAIQAAASPQRIAQAAADDKNETVWAFADVIPGFEAVKLPVTDKFFTAARHDEDAEANVFKLYFARMRPYDVDHTIKVCVPSKYNAPLRSYPSGHATLAYSLGPVLAALIPEKADAIMARAAAYAENRVICGVHYPSDLVASETIGAAIATEWMHNAAFKTAFDAAKAELIAAGLTK